MQTYNIKVKYQRKIIDFEIKADNMVAAMKQGERMAKDVFLEVIGNLMDWRKEAKIKVTQITENSLHAAA